MSIVSYLLKEGTGILAREFGLTNLNQSSLVYHSAFRQYNNLNWLLIDPPNFTLPGQPSTYLGVDKGINIIVGKEDINLLIKSAERMRDITQAIIDQQGDLSGTEIQTSSFLGFKFKERKLVFGDKQTLAILDKLLTKEGKLKDGDLALMHKINNVANKLLAFTDLVNQRKNALASDETKALKSFVDKLDNIQMHRDLEITITMLSSSLLVTSLMLAVLSIAIPPFFFFAIGLALTGALLLLASHLYGNRNTASSEKLFRDHKEIAEQYNTISKELTEGLSEIGKSLNQWVDISIPEAQPVTQESPAA